MQQQHFTYDQWRDQFKPLQNHIQERPFGKALFETYGEEMEHVAAVAQTDPLRVWTVEDADGHMFIVNGLRRVNRLGYLITERPAPANTYIEVDCED